MTMVRNDTRTTVPGPCRFNATFEDFLAAYRKAENVDGMDWPKTPADRIRAYYESGETLDEALIGYQTPLCARRSVVRRLLQFRAWFDKVREGRVAATVAEMTSAREAVAECESLMREHGIAVADHENDFHPNLITFEGDVPATGSLPEPEFGA